MANQQDADRRRAPPLPPADGHNDGSPRRPAGVDSLSVNRTVAAMPTETAPAFYNRAVPADEPITGAVDVLCDKSGFVGLLSYLVPAGMEVRPGDAVKVPFGKRDAYGMAVRGGNLSKATRPVLEVFGKRAAPQDLTLAARIAKFHFSDVTAVYPRLAPQSGRGAEPLTDEVVRLNADETATVVPVDGAGRRTYVRAPLVDAAKLVAAEAARLAHGGQVLVLCPTKELVAEVVGLFASGAQRLDSRAAKGAWKGFITGTVRIGVGTRAGALYSAPNLVGIVVAEEDHPGHVEARQPHTHARDIAISRARALRVAVTLTSANPTPQAVGLGGDITAVGGRRNWPRMTLVDRGRHDPVTRWLPAPVKRALQHETKAGRRPAVVVARRTAARRCERCFEIRPCEKCESSLCRHVATSACPKCGQVAPVKVWGFDKERVEQLVGGGIDVFSPAEISTKLNIGLVVLFDVDVTLAAAELVPDRAATGLVVAAAAAAGPGGSVMAITDNPGADVLQDLFGPRDQLAVAARGLAAAKAAHLPPFGRLVTVRVGREQPPDVTTWPGQVAGPAKVGRDWVVTCRIPVAKLLDLAPAIARQRRLGKTSVTVA